MMDYRLRPGSGATAAIGLHHETSSRGFFDLTEQSERSGEQQQDKWSFGATLGLTLAFSTLLWFAIALIARALF